MSGSKSERNIIENEGMSQVCAVAHKIYFIWSTQGCEALKAYFLDELNFSDDYAELFSKKYNPKNPPAEVCPVRAIKRQHSSSFIFRELALQFESGVNGVWPKNLLGWAIVRYVFGAEVFDFKIGENSRPEQNHNHITFHALPCDGSGNPVPLGLAALEVLEVESVPAHILRKSLMLSGELGSHIGIDITKMFLKADILFPPAREVIQFTDVVRRGLAGEEVILTGAFCPDYTYRETGDPEVPYEYTFEGVTDGIGLVAKQFERIVPYIHELFKEHGIRHRFVLSIGDFEGNSQAILDRVGLTQEEFLARCQGSLDAFERALPGIPMELYFFERDIANGRWKKYSEEAYQTMLAGDFGDIKKHTGKDPIAEVVRFVAKSGRKFYDSWYSKKHTMEELMAMVIAQGSEYAAMGRIITEDFLGQPVIKLAGDRPKMQAFNSVYAEHPTLCTKRTY